MDFNFQNATAQEILVLNEYIGYVHREQIPAEPLKQLLMYEAEFGDNAGAVLLRRHIDAISDKGLPLLDMAELREMATLHEEESEDDAYLLTYQNQS